MEKFFSLFSDIDIRVVYAAAILIGIAGILAIIKKVAKLGIAILVIAIIVAYGGNFLNGVKEKYNFQMDGTEMSIRIIDKDYKVDLLAVGRVVAQDVGNGNVKLEIYGKDKKAYTQPIVLNRTIFQLIKGQASKYEIVVEEK